MSAIPASAVSKCRRSSARFTKGQGLQASEARLPQEPSRCLSAVCTTHQTLTSGPDTSMLWQMPNVEGVIEEGKKVPKKNLDVSLWSLWGQNIASPLVPEIHTPTGWPATSTPVMRSLAGKPGAARKAYNEQYGDAAQGQPLILIGLYIIRAGAARRVYDELHSGAPQELHDCIGGLHALRS